MLRDSMALAIRRLKKRFMIKSPALNGMPFGNSRLGIAPDDVPDGDLFRDQAELEETIGNGLLGIDDLLRHWTDRERRAVGRDGLDFQRYTRHRGQRTRHHI